VFSEGRLQATIYEEERGGTTKLGSGNMDIKYLSRSSFVI